MKGRAEALAPRNKFATYDESGNANFGRRLRKRGGVIHTRVIQEGDVDAIVEQPILRISGAGEGPGDDTTELLKPNRQGGGHTRISDDEHRAVEMARVDRQCSPPGRQSQRRGAIPSS
jgi:hypothetical protein